MSHKITEFSISMTAQQLYQTIFNTDKEDSLALRACEIALEAHNLPQKSSVRSTEVAQTLSQINLDRNTLIATLLSDMDIEAYYPTEQIAEIFGDLIARLCGGIRKLNHFKEFQTASTSNEVQTERLRQMLLAMTSDIRMMIVKLAFRLVRLRTLKNEPETVKKQIACETELIFAPLANRLGIAQLKWEMEDLAFRYQHPNIYKDIAHQLDSKRGEREVYIRNVVQTLKAMINERGIQYKISGRPKHIYSIWKKMTRKNLKIDELYDLRAVRIYVESVQECYEVLGLIHSHWNYIKDEFDDYIASPKENGYQSIHTVVIGAENKTVEIQIRTYEMHQHAEFGVAAHWRYKEDGRSIDPGLEQSINLVRQMLEYNDNPDLLSEISTELLSEHIYVMTPTDEIITMSKGTTPLDFAYQIHTELGHRCRGAKVNGKITPLTYPLKTGDRIEVLTVNGGTPNRNWLNPNLNYLGSSRSRAKVRQWFNQQNKESNIESGEALYHKELKRLHAEHLTIKQILSRFKKDTAETFYEALGKGQINERQLNSAIQGFIKPEKTTKTPRPHSPPDIHIAEVDENKAYVVGVPQLRTSLAPCCSPQKGDDIIGYVTRGRGVTVHKKDCANILNLNFEEQRRLIEVAWHGISAPKPEPYEAVLSLLAYDRKGLLRDVMSVLTELNINLTHSDTHTDKAEGVVTMTLKLDVEPDTNVGRLLDQLEQVSNVVTTSIDINQSS